MTALQELARRCDTLIRLVEKENEEVEAAEQAEKKKSSKKTSGSRGTDSSGGAAGTSTKVSLTPPFLLPGQNVDQTILTDWPGQTDQHMLVKQFWSRLSGQDSMVNIWYGVQAKLWSRCSGQDALASRCWSAIFAITFTEQMLS